MLAIAAAFDDSTCLAVPRLSAAAKPGPFLFAPSKPPDLSTFVLFLPVAVSKVILSSHDRRSLGR